jgi:predicted secreted Zn-dependent protease
MPVNNFDTLISWSNFNQVPVRPSGVNEDAEIHLAFPQKYDYDIGRNGVTITNLTVDISLSLPECWVVTSQATNMVLLKHEQGHYDITALGAREFHDRLKGMSAKNENALNAKIKKLRDGIQAKIDRANLNYDTNTNHSLKTSAQQTWNQKIDAAKKNPKGTIDDLP